MKESQLRLADVTVTTIDMNQLRRQLVKCISYIQVSAARGADPAVPAAELDQMLTAAAAELALVAKATTPIWNVPVVSISASPDEISLSPTETTAQISVAFSPINATDQGLTYDSDTPAVATVDAAGLVTYVGAGSAVITVTSDDGSKTDTVAVTAV